jgi:hypothetical protein
MHANGQMNAIGYAMALLMLPLLLPLVPFLLAFYAVDWLFGQADGGVSDEGPRSERTV